MCVSVHGPEAWDSPFEGLGEGRDVVLPVLGRCPVVPTDPERN